jgi:hypothetical protein
MRGAGASLDARALDLGAFDLGGFICASRICRKIAKPLEICGGRDLLGLVFGPSLLAFGGLALPTFKKGFSTGVGWIEHASILCFGDVKATPGEPEGSHIDENANATSPPSGGLLSRPGDEKGQRGRAATSDFAGTLPRFLTA